MPLGDRKAPWLLTSVYFSALGLRPLCFGKMVYGWAPAMPWMMAVARRSQLRMVLSDPSRNTDQGV